MARLSSIPFDLIEDPETGLELLANRSGEESTEQRLDHLFWQIQFTEWLAWQAGDKLAVGRAAMHCKLAKKELPAWLCRAIHKLSMPDADQRALDKLENHFRRWQAVELVRGQRPGDPRNYKKEQVTGDAVYEEAAELAAAMGVTGGAEAARKSHALMNRAGTTAYGVKGVTLKSYRRAVKYRDRNRPKQRKKSRKS